MRGNVPLTLSISETQYNEFVKRGITEYYV